MIFIILLLGLVLRLTNLNQSLWLDEAISAISARDYSFLGLISDFSLGDTHPPFYYVALKTWSLIFGFSEVSLRSLSVIFGVLTIAIMYLLGKKVGGKKFGIFSSLMMAVSPIHVYYSQEVRMYSFSTLLVLVSIFLFNKISQKNVKLIYWVLFSFSLILIGVVDYLPLVVIVVLWFYAIFTKRNVKWWKKFIVSHIPLILLIIFWYPIFYPQVIGAKNILISFPQWKEVLGTANLKDIALVWVKFIIGRISFSPSLWYAIVVIAASVPYLYGLRRSWLDRSKLNLFWLWLTIPIVLTLIGSLFSPGFSYFRLIFLVPVFYFLVVWGLLKDKKGVIWICLILIINIIFISIFISNKKFWREDWKEAVALVEEKINKNEIVIMAFPDPFASYRWYSKNPTLAYGLDGLIPKDNTLQTSLNNTIFGRKGLYTFDYLMDLTDPDRRIFQILKLSNFNEKKQYSVTGVGLIRYWSINEK